MVAFANTVEDIEEVNVAFEEIRVVKEVNDDVEAVVEGIADTLELPRLVGTTVWFIDVVDPIVAVLICRLCAADAEWLKVSGWLKVRLP